VRAPQDEEEFSRRNFADLIAVVYRLARGRLVVAPAAIR
jgi:hypothetical protein